MAVNDYLHPFSPQDGVEYTRKKESEMPEYVVTVTSSPQTVTVPVGWLYRRSGDCFNRSFCKKKARSLRAVRFNIFHF